jgi:hypothetical protein
MSASPTTAGPLRRDRQGIPFPAAAARALPSHLVVLLVGMLACACTTRSGAGTGESLRSLVDSDFAAMDVESYRKATRQIARATGQAVPADPDARRWGPRAVLEAGERATVLVEVIERAPGEELLRLTQVLDGGRVQWRQSLVLGTGHRFIAAETLRRERLDSPVLALRLQDEGDQPETLFLALRADQPLPLRYERAGQLANPELFLLHPELEVIRGRIVGDDAVQRLAATLALSNPAEAKERGKPALRSHLQALATGSPDVWLAQAAAAVLTLPAE